MRKILPILFFCFFLAEVSFSQGELRLTHLSTHFTDVFDEGAAEIVTFDAMSKRLFFSNASANTIGVLDISDPLDPSAIDTIILDAYGASVNSVAARNGLIAVAVQALEVDGAGNVVFFDTDGNFLKEVAVGVLPDMLIFTPDGTKVLTANEGEPSGDYTIDPEGSVSIIDLSNGVENALVTEVSFADYNGKKAHLLNKGVRIFGPGASVAQDLEPEYVAVTPDGSRAYVGLQENNAMAVIDIAEAKVLDIYPFGFKDHGKGAPILTEYVLNEVIEGWPALGAPVYGGGQPEVLLGGFSGLYFDPTQSTDEQYVFYAVPDRGPNDAAVSRSTVSPSPLQNIRPFKLPEYQGRIVKFTLDNNTGAVTLDDQILLSRPNGAPITGFGNAPGVDEVPVAYTDPATAYADTNFIDAEGTPYHLLEYDAFGGDFEGILKDKDGNFWMCDEYRPAIYQFDPSGVLMNRYVAEGTKAQVVTEDIFFSEYGEGSSNNKYLEIYNGTPDTIDLNNYKLVSCGNACAAEGEFEFDNSGVIADRKIAPGDVLVITHPEAQDDILAKADTTFTFLSNGNDWFALIRAADSSIVDQIGVASLDPPSNGWDVAGVSEATKDYTLIRKHYILKGAADWAASAGTNARNSEWIVEERPTADTVLAALGSHMDYGAETLPSVYKKRRANRGFEAIAYDADNNLIYAFIQSPIENPGSSVRNNTDVIRILGIDAADGTPVEEYVYLLERNKESGLGLSRVDKMGDAVYIGGGRFLVLERDSGRPDQGNTSKKYVFEVDISAATNILGMALAGKETSGGEDDKTLEMMSADDLAAMGIVPAHKYKVLNLPSVGYLPSDKPEGIALLPNGAIAVMNDNDFGLAGAGVSDASSLGIIEFDDNYGLDASDRDDAINIDQQPVLGMYQPDAMTAYTAPDGQTYIVIVNEGDARDYDGFAEEERIKDITLDPTLFPKADSLQADEVIGRLNITLANGDLDGDGDYDRLYAYGARSFTILDVFGNIVYDSGDEFEQITAALLPDDFNSNNDENQSFESRSDNKGVEPEAITITTIGDSIYALIGFERIGGVIIYNITNPIAPSYVSYTNNRDFSVTDAASRDAGDLGVENIVFIPAAESPNGKDLVVTANEVSGTISLFNFGEEISSIAGLDRKTVSWDVFPNPVQSVLFTSQVSDYSVSNLLGQRLILASNAYQINVKNIPSGTYVITDVRNGGSQLFMKR